MNRIETVPVIYVKNIWDDELPKEITENPPKVKEFIKKFKLETANCTIKGCGGTFIYKASQDRAADEGMNIRFVCSACGLVVR